MREIPIAPDRWRDILDTALEHASHAWYALERQGGVNRLNEDAWPPKVNNPVGSAPYHFAAFIGYVQEVYEGIVKVHPDPEDDWSNEEQ